MATDDFANTYLVKSHRDDMVYKAEIDHFDRESVLKKTVLIKRIINHDKLKEVFYAEIEMLNRCKHPNLLSLVGFCDEESEMIVVFECDSKETLDFYLGNTSNTTINLTWEQRIHVCLDIANALNYLHNMGGKTSMIHRIVSANVFLDEKWTAKIADFRLSELSSYPTSLKRSGYENFRNWLWGNVDAPWIPSWKRFVVDDVYSLGVILFEILTGRLSMVENGNGFASFRRGHNNEETLKNMVDPRIMEEAQEYSYTSRKGPNQDSLDAFSKITNQCLAEISSERPTLDVVIKSLEKALHFQVHLKHMKIPLSDIISATKNFDKEYLLGSGGYGEVYKAELNQFSNRSFLETKMKSEDEHQKTCSTVAVKRIFRKKDGQGKEGFVVELDVLSKCKHPNIVRLLGFCVEGDEMLLVYEHVSNGSLDDYLRAPHFNMTWAQRLNMCIDIACGLHYLHTPNEDKKGIVHRDIKSDNILLGKNWEVKIADFGFSKFHPGNQHGSTIKTNHIAGTDFYRDPEYARTGKLKKASDVYSFGVVLFEILSGKLAYDSSFTLGNANGLASIAKQHFETGTLKDIMDLKLMDEAHELTSILKVGPDHVSVNTFLNIAYQCLAKNQAKRPTIEQVIKELKKALKFQENRKDAFKFRLKDLEMGTRNFNVDSSITGGDMKLYKGEVPYNGGEKKVVVKRFSKSKQFHLSGFLTEFEVLFKHKQQNIIGLVGYCKEADEKIIVYEDASNGYLNTYLNDTRLTWRTRLKICVDIANGLKFLHGDDIVKDVVIHGDIKSSNILLTEDWKAKICGFDHSHIYHTNQKMKNAIHDVVGFYYQKKRDIYLFGVILFEILCGRLVHIKEFTDNRRFLDNLVKRHTRVDDMVFEGIKEQIVHESLVTFKNIAFQCLHEKREKRPTAGEAVVQLQNALESQEAYEIWEAKLPKNYKEIMQDSKLKESYSTMAKKDIHDILSKGIPLQDDKRWFSIDDNGEKHEMISARMFSYKLRQSRRWRSTLGSKFPKVAKMLDISNINIDIKIRPQYLPSDVKYRVHLVFKFCGPSKPYGQRMYVNLKYKIGSENLHAYFATWREDEWMMIELRPFSNEKNDTNFEVLLEGFSRTYCDRRAVYIQGIEFRAIENVKQEKIENLQIQHVVKSPSEMKKKKRKVVHMESAEGIVYDKSNLAPYNSLSSTRSRVEWIYKVPQQSVFGIKWDIKEYRKMSPNSECGCYLVFKLLKDCQGLHCPVIVRDRFHVKSKEIIYFRSPKPWNLHDTDRVPKKRGDGWMEVMVSKFNSDFVLKKGCLFGKLKLVTYEGTMSGLIIGGIEFRHIEA